MKNQFDSKVAKTYEEVSREQQEEFKPQIIEAKTIADLLVDLDFVDGLFSKERVSGYSTGFSSLDKIAGGIKKQGCIILAGDSGMGKSVFAINIILNVAKQGIKVAYFDLENGAYESVERILRIKHGFSQKFFSSDENKKKIPDMVKELENFVYFSHEGLEGHGFYKNPLGVLNSAISQLSDRGYEVFLVDPLQAIETQVSSSNQLNEQGFIVQSLKNLAQKKNVSIIICHHMRKSTKGGEFVESVEDVKTAKYRVPTLEDLKGSSKIGDFATAVWGLVRNRSEKEISDRGKTLVRVLKNRNGALGDSHFYFDESTLSFTKLYSENFYARENNGVDLESLF